MALWPLSGACSGPAGEAAAVAVHVVREAAAVAANVVEGAAAVASGAAVAAVRSRPALAAGVTAVSAAARYVASLDLPPTLEGQLLRKIQKTEQQMVEAKTFEDMMSINLEMYEILSTFDEQIKAMSENPELPSDLKEALQNVSSSFEDLLHQVLSFGPKIRKHCLSRQFGAKYVQKLQETYKKSGEVNTNLLDKAMSKFIPDITAEEEHGIRNRMITVAHEIDAISQQVEGIAERIRQRAEDTMNAAKDASQRCCPGWGKWQILKAIAGVCCLLGGGMWMLAAGIVAKAFIPLSFIGMGVLIVKSARNDARVNKEEHDQLKQAEADARIAFTAQIERYRGLNELHQKLSDAVTSTRRLAISVSVIRGLLGEIGVDTHEFNGSLEDAWLLGEFSSNGLTQRLDAYIQKNKDLIEKVRDMELELLNICARLMDRSSLPKPLPNFQPDVSGWMESANPQCPTESSVSSEPWIVEEGNGSSSSNSPSQGNSQSTV